MDWLLIIGGCVFSLVFLVAGAELFIRGAVAVSVVYRLSPIFIGCVVVGFGTSAPELFFSSLSSLQGQGEMALGNVLGSNVANLCLVLGAVVMFSPLKGDKRLIRFEIPSVIVATLVLVGLALDGGLSRIDGALMFIGGVVFLWLGYHRAQDTDSSDLQENYSFFKRWMYVLLGMGLLLGGSELFILSGSQLAHKLGVSPFFVALTIVAVGTSLPELAASISSVRQGHTEIGLGNILGSNVLNIVAVLGVAAMINPIKLAPDMLRVDMLGLLLLTGLGLFILATSKRIGRLHGLALLIGYFSYIFWTY